MAAAGRASVARRLSGLAIDQAMDFLEGAVAVGKCLIGESFLKKAFEGHYRMFNLVPFRNGERERSFLAVEYVEERSKSLSSGVSVHDVPQAIGQERAMLTGEDDRAGLNLEIDTRQIFHRGVPESEFLPSFRS